MADVLMVSHTHWDREWYRTFEAFRARLIDTVDRVLDLLAEDPGWKFLLDGQAIVIEDYLEVRPGRRSELEASVRAGRLGVGPWYVQPDSLLPGGESMIRNLLEGRRVATSVGGCSEVAYTPDSFGHPAQFPQLFAGFGLGPFVYWRGNGSELDDLGSVWRWRSPDGSSVLAYHLTRGYFAAACLNEDVDTAVEGVVGLLERIGPVERAPVVLMNGIDHMLPDAHTGAVADALAKRTGLDVQRGVLDDLLPVDGADRPEFAGELLGARTANLLPGVWSARLDLKLANRAAERALIGWAEPFTALAAALGLPDERPSVRTAWRTLLPNHAHDSICGCSQDEVHRQMQPRFASATELATQTTRRVLERLAGLGPERRVPRSTTIELAVFNPSPFPRSDVVTFGLDGFPVYFMSDIAQDVHPLVLAAATVRGYVCDGAPVRTVRSAEPGRFHLTEDLAPLDVELVVRDVPAFGWKRVVLEPGEAAPDDVDAGTVIEADDVRVELEASGGFTVHLGDRDLHGIAAIEHLGDQGDTYDFDPVPDDPGTTAVAEITHERLRHASGIQRLRVTRTLAVGGPHGPTTVTTEARVAPGLRRVDLHVEVHDPAHDRRLRLLFPTGAPAEQYRAATTLDVTERQTARPDDSEWVHPAPETFPHQGWIAANGVAVGAPGLPEGEVRPDGTIAVTLLRSIGWLARFTLGRRPIPAGPTIPTPDAQMEAGVVADLSLSLDPGPAVLGADELGLRAVHAGDGPVAPEGASLLALEPSSLVLSAVRPGDDGRVVVRVLNPTDQSVDGSLTLGFPVGTVESVRLDEMPDGRACNLDGQLVGFTVGPHELRTLALRTA
ncbi:MAG: glycoside hydrolase family 38 C-terminal domain-containing protein [Acidimicrobiia bacterium]